jgi:acetylglutamate kinase
VEEARLVNATACFVLPMRRGGVFLAEVRDLISKADVLLEALPFLQRYRAKTFVIKYGGSFMDSPDSAARDGVARDIVFLAAAGIRPVVVHGGGKAITRAMEKAGLKASFVQGMRVTDEATAEVVERVLSSEINPEIAGTINRLGGKARGFSGTTVLKARKLWLEADGQKFDAGFLGEVAAVLVEPLRQCLDAGGIPVCSPTALGDDGRIYNCNADVAAAQVAIALQAQRLIFMSDVPGVLRDPKDLSSVIPHLRVAEVESLKKAGIIDKGMIPKADSAVKALQAGVDKVSFVDGRVPHSILLEIFTDEGVGTELAL